MSKTFETLTEALKFLRKDGFETAVGSREIVITWLDEGGWRVTYE